MNSRALRVPGNTLGGHGKDVLPWQTREPVKNSQKMQTRRTFQVRAIATEPATTWKHVRREQNVAGEFYVDSSCIDCDTCRWMVPEVFSQVDEQSAVRKQPSTPEQRFKSLQALVSCPTGSIRTITPAKDILQVQDSFPLLIDENLPGVYHCGFHSKSSYGATTYFIQRKDGNILVDSPRFIERLAKRMEEMGVVKYMFLTHKDDVADHKKWQKRFNCKRILHSVEVRPDTADVETKLEGTGPWTLGSDVELIFTPGHTPAHVCLFLKDRQALFTGDHLYANMENELFVDLKHNWYSVEKQVQSLEALKELDFTWVLPGHDRRYQFQDLEDKNVTIMKLVAEYGGSRRG